MIAGNHLDPATRVREANIIEIMLCNIKRYYTGYFSSGYLEVGLVSERIYETVQICSGITQMVKCSRESFIYTKFKGNFFLHLFI